MNLQHKSDFSSIDPKAMEAQAHAVMGAAFEGGVRHFDAARSYGRAEEFLASWLASRRPAGVIVSSKWGYRYTANWRSDAEVHEVKDHSLKHLESQWRESDAILGKALQIYQVHSATLESGVLKDEGVLERLALLRDAGVQVGLSVTGPRQGEIIDAAIAISRGGRRLFDWVQATWNVLEPSAAPALGRAKAVGMKTIAKEGMANGRLSPRGDVKAWLELAASTNTAPDALALAVALRQPFLDVVLSGAATVQHLRSNLAAAQVKVIPTVDRFAIEPVAYWGERSRLLWS